MRAGMRAAAVIPVLLLLCWLSVQALNRGRAETLVYDASREMITWPAVQAPKVETWDWVRDDLLAALDLSPRDPTAHEALAVLETERLDSLEFLQDADVHLRTALALRPSSPYTWVNFSALRYRLNDTGAPFETALVEAVHLGPGEPEVQRRVADLGLAVWDEITPPTKAAVLQSIEWGMRRNAPEMLQIAERRGRLRVTCSVASRVSGYMQSRWYPLCESTEAYQ